MNKLIREIRIFVFFWNLHMADMNTGRSPWIWVGHVGISFRRTWRFSTKLMIKTCARRGIRVSQFGPLLWTQEESR